MLSATMIPSPTIVVMNASAIISAVRASGAVI
jgi:hypothetical protein